MKVALARARARLASALTRPRVLSLVAATSVVCVLVAGTEIVQRRSSIFSTASSCMLVIFSAYGLGSLLERVLLRTGPRAGFGVLATWGLALLLTAAGWLVLLQSASVTAARVLGAGGLVLGLWRVSEPGTFLPIRRWRWPEVVVGGGVAFAALARCAAMHGIRGEGYPWDDAPAYLPFVKQLAETGSMSQEFCLRRMVSLGGQTFLQVFQLAGGGSVLGYANVFDWGTCSLLLVLLVLSLPATTLGTRAMRLLGALLAFTLPYSRWNTAACMSGVVFLVAAWQTDNWAREERQARVELIATPLLIAALCTLRNNYLVIGALYLILRAASFRTTSTPWRQALRDAAVSGGIVVAVLLPWSIESYRLFATPYYPLGHGFTVAAATGLTSNPTLAHRAVALIANVTYPHATFGFGLIAVAMVAALLRSKPRTADPTKALLGSYVIGYLVQWWMLPAIDPLGHTRYVFASLAATVLVIVSSGGRSRGFRAVDIGLCCVVVALHLDARQQQAGDILREQVESHLDPRDSLFGAGEAVKRANAVAAESAQAPRYTALQKACAPGETILSMLEESYRLDFRRNRIVLLDFPGSLGLGGPPPVLEAPELVARYFRERGVRYVAFTKPTVSQGIYSRGPWESHKQSTDALWATHKAMAPYWLGAIDFMDSLEKDGPVVFSDDKTVVVDLSPR